MGLRLMQQVRRVALQWIAGERYSRVPEDHEGGPMPGGRLTQQERQQIALGLADDLPYAEIARRIDRPTSTVTREVMRNGGPTGYRADLAHRAAERRAHRRAAPARGPLPVDRSADRPADGRDPEAVDAFEEAITTVFMHSGMS